MKNANSRPKTRLDIIIITWQGWEAGNQTSDDDNWSSDIEEICDLFNDQESQ